MTLVSTIPAATPESALQTNVNESLSLGTETLIHPDPESSPVELKAERNALQELFEQTLIEKGENEGNKFKWVGDNEIQVDGLSGLTLHNFLLKAEALGKKITYRRSIVFTITD